MRQAKRWRYYCDHCKKSGGHAGHMRKHEKHCTMNPDRSCRMCDVAGTGGLSVSEMVSKLTEFLKKHTPSLQEALNTNPEILTEVRDIAEGCPACMMAIIRQLPQEQWELGIEAFDYKKERDEFWERENELHGSNCW